MFIISIALISNNILAQNDVCHFPFSSSILSNPMHLTQPVIYHHICNISTIVIYPRRYLSLYWINRLKPACQLHQQQARNRAPAEWTNHNRRQLPRKKLPCPRCLSKNFKPELTSLVWSNRPYKRPLLHHW